MKIRHRPCPDSIPARLRDLALKHHIGVTMKCLSSAGTDPIYIVTCPGTGREVGYGVTTVRAAMSRVRWAAKVCRKAAPA